MIFTPELKFIQEKIITAAYPNIILGEAKQSYICYTKNDVYLMAWIFWFDPGQVIERMSEYWDIWVQLYPSSLSLHWDIWVTSGVYRASPENDIYYISSTSIDDLVNYQKIVKKYRDLRKLLPSLSRVLKWLGEYDYIYRDWSIYELRPSCSYEDDDRYRMDIICNRKLLRDDWSDATLFDQSSDIITEIAHEMMSKEKF